MKEKYFWSGNLRVWDGTVDEFIRLSGVDDKTSLINLGLEALIARESARRLADLGGTEKKLKKIPRRRQGIHRDAR